MHRSDLLERYRRVVYGVSEAVFYRLVGGRLEDVLQLLCRKVVVHGNRMVEVIGPLLEGGWRHRLFFEIILKSENDVSEMGECGK